MLKIIAQLTESTNLNSFMLKAFLEHYASFVESQTGKPKEDVLKEIKTAAKENPERKEMDEILSGLSKALDISQKQL